MTAYGDPDYRAARELLAAGNVACAHHGPRCTGVATSPDHVPALADHDHVAGSGCCTLLPSCAPCNLARAGPPNEPASPPAIAVEARRRLGLAMTAARKWIVQWNGGATTTYRDEASARRGVERAGGRAGPTTLRPAPFDLRGEVVSIVRPGPEWIPPGLAPRGVVLHVYAVPSCHLLLVRHLSAVDDLERLAVDDAEFVTAVTDACCLVAWDGDTGRRLTRGMTL